MRQRFNLQPKPVTKAVGTFITLLAAASAMAGPGYGDAYDKNNQPFATPLQTYFASSPAGARQWVDANGNPAPLTGAPAGYGNPGAYSALIPAGYQGTGKALRKFVDTLPGLGASLPGAIGVGAEKYIPVAKPVKWVNPQGVATTDDYYEIAVIEYADKFHSDLKKATTVRGYVQIDHEASNNRTPIAGSQALQLYYPNSSGKVVFGPNDTIPADALKVQIAGTDTKGKLTGFKVDAKVVEAPHYLGPVIAATKDIPTRVKFLNLMPVGRAETETDANGNLAVKMGANGLPLRHGDIFLPVDKSLMGAGYGPDGLHTYPQNRANIHLHGGDTPWISDGTPHQWITPAGEVDPAVPGSVASDQTLDPSLVPNFTRGPSTANVPDMNDPGAGANTYYFPNGQSARLLWYHDHSVGMTRLNVYAGMASAYALTDPIEQDLVARGVLPDAASTIPLVLQEKTFVPDDIGFQDARWSTTAWGAPGDMWYPHVYETVQASPSTAQATNFNAVGRWHWGPWFWPSFPALYELPTGAYGDETTVPEAWGDTPIINGVAYPTLTVDPKAYRFRILNASNDRTFTFNLFVADPDTQAAVIDDVTGEPALVNGEPQFRANTEVKMVAVNSWANSVCDAGVTRSDGVCTPDTWTTDVYGHAGGVPDATLAGPSIYQIASEGGLLPGVAIKDPTPISYLLDKGRAAVLNTDYGLTGLHLGNAERADVVIDFSQYAGKTLIVYNDAGAPVPAADPRNEYFTGYGDNSATGGAEDTRAGYGPNTRTMMQIVVKDVAPAPAFDLNRLQNELPVAYANSQERPIVAQSAYNAAVKPAANWDDTNSFADIYAGSLKEPTFKYVPGTPSTFNSIIVNSFGSGYTRTPTVTLSGGTGSGATAEATLKISRIHVIDGGAGYKIAPTVTINSLGKGSGAGATTNLKVGSVAVTAGGTGYSIGAVQTVTVPVGSGGSYRAVPSATVTNAATNQYSRTGTITATVSGGGGTGAVATVTTSNFTVGRTQYRHVTGITITGGTGYTSAPTVTLGGTATVYTAATYTTAVAATPPTVTFPAPVGGAAATGTVVFDAATGTVTGVTLVSGGRGYATAPVPTFVGGSVVTAATATTTVSALPTITFSAPLGRAFTYDLAGKLIVDANDVPVLGTGITATGVAQVSAAGAITGVTITNPGSGYTIPPSISVNKGVVPAQGSGAVFTVMGAVGDVMLDVPDPSNSMTSGGGGYDNLATLASEPNSLTPGLTISFSPPTGTGARVATAGATGKVFDITLTNVGSGYTAAGLPSVTVTPSAAEPVYSATVVTPQNPLAPTAAEAKYTPLNIAKVAATASTDASQGKVIGSNLVKTKAIQELFEPTYGRLNATLGVEIPFTSALTQTTIPLGYIDTPTEDFQDGETQIWKITHNGVDTHPVHFHLLNVQLINRVGWDNFVTPPEPNELGWKETIKMSPLEDVIVAVRAKRPNTKRPILGTTLTGNTYVTGYEPGSGFGMKNSVRLLDPTQPEGAMTGFTQIDPNTGLPAPMANVTFDYNWEYVWHCHILGHEENDFMRAVVFHANDAAPAAATGLAAAVDGTTVNLTWTDAANTEYGYQVYRGPNVANNASWTLLGELPANSNAFADTTAGANPVYSYKVVAVGQGGVGNAVATVGTVAPPVLPLPSNLTAAPAGSGRVTLNWTDIAGNLGYAIQYSTNGGTTWSGNLTTGGSPRLNATIGANSTSGQVRNLANSTTYKFRLQATGAAVDNSWVVLPTNVVVSGGGTVTVQ